MLLAHTESSATESTACACNISSISEFLSTQTQRAVTGVAAAGTHQSSFFSPAGFAAVLAPAACCATSWPPPPAPTWPPGPLLPPPLLLAPASAPLPCSVRYRSCCLATRAATARRAASRCSLGGTVVRIMKSTVSSTSDDAMNTRPMMGCCTGGGHGGERMVVVGGGGWGGGGGGGATTAASQQQEARCPKAHPQDIVTSKSRTRTCKFNQAESTRRGRALPLQAWASSPHLTPPPPPAGSSGANLHGAARRSRPLPHQRAVASERHACHVAKGIESRHHGQ